MGAPDRLRHLDGVATATTTWAWPLLALVLALPKTWVVLFYGNTDMWLTAFVAGAVLWAWPAVLITIKPSLVFLAAIGITRRSWWVAAVVFALSTCR